MPESAHQRYRTQLTALSQDGWLLARVAEAAQRASWRGSGSAWTRTYESFEPFTDPFATIVFETEEEPQEVCLVEAFTEPPPAHDGAGAGGPLSGAGASFEGEAACWLRLRRFPSDGRLPTLPDLLAEPGTWRVARYRPHRRCTLRFEVEGRRQFVKVYPDDRAERIHREGQALWSAAQEGQLAFAVARPVRWSREQRAVWWEEIVGKPVLGTLARDLDPPLAARMGAAAASIGLAALAPAELLDRAAQLARAGIHAADLSARIPALASTAGRLVESLGELHRTASASQPRPIHGALHARQWLVDGAHLGLVDFDRFSMGDPEADAATFLADMELKRAEKTSVDAIKKAFLTGYESIAGTLNETLLRAYRAQRGLTKALKAARALRPDGDRRAGAALHRASDLIEGASQ